MELRGYMNKWLKRLQQLRYIITNGILLIAIGIMHTKLAVSSDGFGSQFQTFSQKNYFQISSGLAQLPAVHGKCDFESAAAFWFFYFGIMLIPMGMLVHTIERKREKLPKLFLFCYFSVVIIGAYMIPNSGMTYIMFPHALYMLLTNRPGART